MRTAACIVVILSVAWCGFTAGASAQSEARGAAEPNSPDAAPPPSSSTAAPLDFTAAPALAREPEHASKRAAAPSAPHSPVALTEDARLRPNALNLSVLGFLIGAVRLTYTRALLPKHGVFAEAIVLPDVLRGFAFVGVGGAVGYNFYWRGPKTSGFVGGTLSVTRTSGTTPTFRLGKEDMPDFRGSVWTIGIAPHAGKRWLFEKSGINLTLRAGGGVAYHVADAWRGTEKGAKQNLERSFIIADGELSVGYSF
jgi:hypothetical protein